MWSETMGLFKCPKDFYSEENEPVVFEEFGKALGNMWHDANCESIFTCEFSWESPTHILNWFAQHVDVDFHEKLYLTCISKEQLISLMKICETVMFNAIAKDGSIDIEFCKKNMPIAIDGVFFKDAFYDLNYLHIIKGTADGVRKLLKNTDFEKEVILLFVFIPLLRYIPKQWCYEHNPICSNFDESYYDPYDIENHL